MAQLASNRTAGNSVQVEIKNENFTVTDVTARTHVVTRPRIGQFDGVVWPRTAKKYTKIYKVCAESSFLCDVLVAVPVGASNTREFKKLLRRRQRERHKTIGYNEKNKGPARAL